MTACFDSPGDLLHIMIAESPLTAVKTMPGITRRVMVLTTWAVYVKPDLTRVAVPRRANGPDPEPPLGVHEHESSGDRREHPLMHDAAMRYARTPDAAEGRDAKNPGPAGALMTSIR